MSKRANAMDVALSAIRSGKGSKRSKKSTEDLFSDKDASYNFDTELLSVLCAYRDEYGAPSTRVDFINNLLTLSTKNLKKFINDYIKQYETYTDYFETWKANPLLNTQHESHKKFKQAELTADPNRFDVLRKAGHQLDDIKRYWLSKKITVKQLREKLKSLGEYPEALVDTFDAKRIRMILRKKYGEQPAKQTAIEQNRERMNLVRKLALLSERPLDYYHDWPLEKLRKHLTDDYWDEFSFKENMIDIIARATNRSRQELEQLSVEELEREIDQIDNQIGIQYSQLVTNIDPVRTSEEIQLLKCYTNYLKYDWIDARVFDVFVHASKEGYQVGEVIFRKYPKVKFGRPTMQFFRLLCDDQTVKTQVNDRLLLTTQDGIVSFMIVFVVTGNLKELKAEYGNDSISRLGKPLIVEKSEKGTPKFVQYKLPKQFVHSQEWRSTFQPDLDEVEDAKQVKNLLLLTQTEKLFEQETKFRFEERQEYYQAVLQLLDQQIDQNSILVAKQYLGTRLQQFGTTKDEKVDDYVPNSNFVSEAIQSVVSRDSKQTNRSLFQSIANITVYMNLIPAKTFRHRLTEQYYSPIILMSLSPSDMLPEMYDEITGDSLTTEISRRNMATYIAEKINDTVFSLGMTLERSFSLRRRVEIKTNNVEPVLLLVEKKCENQCDNPEVFYRDSETGLIYCFTLHEIHELLTTESNNPHTNKPFSQNFIDKMNDTLNKVEYGLFRGESETTDSKNEVLEEKNQLIIPTLWDIVYRQSREYIGNTSIFKFGDGDEPDLEENDRYFDREESEDDELDDDDDVETTDTASSMEDDEEMDDEDATTDVDEDATTDVDEDATMETITNDNMNDTDVEDDDGKMGFGSTKNAAIKTNNATETVQCGTCKNDEMQLKSIIFDESGTNPKLITFCGVECFETYDWPKYGGNRVK